MKTTALFLLTSALSFAAGPIIPPIENPNSKIQNPAAPAPCCPVEKPAPKKELCCEELAAVPFTKNSLYQADVAFTTDTGAPFKLGALRGRPVVLAMFFATCGYACPLTVTDMQAIRDKLPAAIRDRAAFVLVTFDVARDTTEVLAKYRAQISGADWVRMEWTMPGSQCGVRGGLTRRMPTSSGRLSPFFWLQRMQAVTIFSQVFFPPRTTGLTWSSVSSRSVKRTRQY